MGDIGTAECLQKLTVILDAAGKMALAVSGGVDSMTLAHIAHERSQADLTVFHAVSPAVPPLATARVRDHAAAWGWTLQVIGAGEFDDPDYLTNPLNRCYFCKSNLYSRIRAETGAVICSGTNADDLGDFRPGLGAAEQHGVRHPFVEAGINKAMIRQLAASLGLDDLSDLPAQPCLASRVETGLPIRADELALVDRIETMLADEMGPGDIRCRVTREGIRIELPPARIAALRDASLMRELTREIAAAGHRFAGLASYRRGSAFLKDHAP